MKQSIRNIVIFGIVTLACGFLGHAVNTLYQPPDPMQSLGILIWLISPLAANLILRSLGKEGWKDFGIRLQLKSSWVWYLAALLIVPLISLVLIGLGRMLGVTILSGERGTKVFFTLFATAFAGNVVKNIFEEFAWRGFLTPVLEKIKASPVLNSLVTGLIWAGWHIPYYLFFLSPTLLAEQTSLNVPTLIALSFLLLPLQAIVYGELRLISKSVWPAWLLHTMSNAVGYALIFGGFVSFPKNLSSVLLTPGTEGIAYALLMAVIGWGLYQRRKRTA